MGMWIFVAAALVAVLPISSAATSFQWANFTLGSGSVCGTSETNEAYCLGYTWPSVNVIKTVKQFNESWGALGAGTLEPSAEWVEVAGGAVWRYIAAGSQHTCGLRLDGEIRCWGENWWGQLGDGVQGHLATESDRVEPTRFGPLYPFGASPGKYTQLSSGATHTCALTGSGVALCAGANQYGQLGSGDRPAGTNENATGSVLLRGSPVPVSVPDVWRGQYSDPDPERLAEVETPGPWVSISAGADIACAVDRNATAWCWGLNHYGALGIGLVPGDAECRQGSAAELKLPCIANTPQRVKGGHRWRFIKVSISPSGDNGSVYVCGLTLEGRALCWGDLGYYDGDGDIVPDSQFSPAFVDTNTTYADLVVGGAYACGIVAANSTVQCWGADSAGQFGDPEYWCFGSWPGVDYPWPCFTADRPVQAAGGLQVRSIAAGPYSMYAILLNGTALSWGWDQGQLGYGPLNKTSLALPRGPAAVNEPKAVRVSPAPRPPINGTADAAEDSGTTPGALAGIIIGSVAVAGVAVVGGAWAYRRRRSRRAQSSSTSSTTKFADDDVEAPLTVPDIAGADAALPPGSISFDENADGKRVVLGAGQFGTVYSGRLFGEAVAVKCVPLQVGGGVAADRLLAEVAVLKACRSDRIVQYRGHEVRTDAAGGREVLLATELLAGGDLCDALDNELVSWKQGGARIALDVASGLQYLHSRSPRILHLDIKSKNVLLAAESGGWRAKIADVGLSLVLSASKNYLSSNLAAQGTLAWAAPEQLLGQRCTVAADVFALGVVMWEVVTREAPIRGRMREVAVPDECPAEVAALMAQCWAAEPGDRPSAAQCVSVLRKFV